MGLTQLKPSVEPNAAEIVSKILDRFRLASGFNLKPDEEETKMRVIAWLEILGTAKIPVKYYDRLYQKAMVTRGRRKGQGVQVSYFIAPEDLIAEYDEFLRELADRENEELKQCSQMHDDEEDRLISYFFCNEVEIILPCHECRGEAHRKRIAERLDRKKENRLRLVEKSNGIKFSD